MRLSAALLLPAFGLAAGCWDDAASAGPVGPAELDVIDDPPGFPFVRQVVAISDLCDIGTAHGCALAHHAPDGATNALVREPMPGKLCLTGTIGAGGYAAIVLIFTKYAFPPDAPPTIVETFDADALGATALAFDVESPPESGLTLYGSVIAALSCPEDVADCRTSGFLLMTDATTNEVEVIRDTGSILAPFASFVQTDPEHASSTFDTSTLDAVFLLVEAGAYDFCISSFRFLSADGVEITPS